LLCSLPKPWGLGSDSSGSKGSSLTSPMVSQDPGVTSVLMGWKMGMSDALRPIHSFFD
jgi:hypothetical protein